MKTTSFAVGASVALFLIVLASAGARADATPPAKTEAPTGAYTLDKNHSTLLFRVDHLAFSKYVGRFVRFDVTLRLDTKHPEKSHVDAMIDPKSLETPPPPEGFVATLLGKEWLAADQFPKMEFHSTAIRMTGANTAAITGDFTMHGVTKPVVLDATFNGGYAGNIYDPQARVGFSAHGVLKRSEFGISIGLPPPGTNMGVGDEVEIAIEAEFNGPAWKTPKKK